MTNGPAAFGEPIQFDAPTCTTHAPFGSVKTVYGVFFTSDQPPLPAGTLIGLPSIATSTADTGEK